MSVVATPRRPPAEDNEPWVVALVTEILMKVSRPLKRSEIVRRVLRDRRLAGSMNRAQVYTTRGLAYLRRRHQLVVERGRYSLVGRGSVRSDQALTTFHDAAEELVELAYDWEGTDHGTAWGSPSPYVTLERRTLLRDRAASFPETTATERMLLLYRFLILVDLLPEVGRVVINKAFDLDEMVEERPRLIRARASRSLGNSH